MVITYIVDVVIVTWLAWCGTDKLIYSLYIDSGNPSNLEKKVA